MAAHRPPEHFDSVLAHFAVEALPKAKVGVSFLKEGKIIFLNILAVFHTDLSDLGPSHCQDVVLGDPGNDLFLLSLVLQHIDFLFLLVDPLASEKRVPRGSNDGSSKNPGVGVDDSFPDEHQCPETHPRISHLLELAFISDLSIFCEEIHFGNPDVSEVEVAIFLAVEAKFGPDISHLHSWKLPEVLAPDGDQEGVDSVALALYDSLGKNDGVVREEGHVPWPVFGRRGGGRVHYPLLCGRIVGGGGFKAPDVRPVAHFNLSVTAPDFTVERLLKVEPLVLLGAHKVDVLGEHAEVDRAGHLVGGCQEAVVVEVVEVEPFPGLVHVAVVDEGEVPVGIEEKGKLALVVEVGSEVEGGPLPEVLLEVPVELSPVEETAQVVRGKGGFLSLLLENSLHCDFNRFYRVDENDIIGKVIPINHLGDKFFSSQVILVKLHHLKRKSIQTKSLKADYKFEFFNVLHQGSVLGTFLCQTLEEDSDLPNLGDVRPLVEQQLQFEEGGLLLGVYLNRLLVVVEC